MEVWNWGLGLGMSVVRVWAWPDCCLFVLLGLLGLRRCKLPYGCAVGPWPLTLLLACLWPAATPLLPPAAVQADHLRQPENWACVEKARVIYSAGFFITGALGYGIALGTQVDQCCRPNSGSLTGRHPCHRC